MWLLTNALLTNVCHVDGMVLLVFNLQWACTYLGTIVVALTCNARILIDGNLDGVV